MDTTTNLNQELDALEHRRELLLKLVNTTRALEGLRIALQASASEDGGASEVPDLDIKNLDADTRNQSDAEVLLKLESLDEKAAKSLQPILNIIRNNSLLDSRLLDDSLSAKLFHKIDVFRRLVETALTLRVMLSHRNVPVPAFVMPMAPGELKQYLKLVESKEVSCRHSVVDEITSMHHEVARLLDSPSCKPSVQAFLQMALDGLQQNLTHLEAGHSIKELPMALDVIDLSVDGKDAAEAAFTPEASVEKPKKAVTEDKKNVPVEPEEDRSSWSFWKKLWVWFNTPWKKSWKDIDND